MLSGIIEIHWHTDIQAVDGEPPDCAVEALSHPHINIVFACIIYIHSELNPVADVRGFCLNSLYPPLAEAWDDLRDSLWRCDRKILGLFKLWGTPRGWR